MEEKIENPEINENEEIILNNVQSDIKAKEGEGEIKKFDEIFPDHQAHEDIDEISSTDDV